MFDDKTLKKIFRDEEAQGVPPVYQFIMTRVIERILEEEKDKKNETYK